MPWTSGGAAVNIEAKQTGVTDGVRAIASVATGAWRRTWAKASGCSAVIRAPIPSAAKISPRAIDDSRPSTDSRPSMDSRATSVNGGDVHAEGGATPKSRQTVGVTEASDAR